MVDTAKMTSGRNVPTMTTSSRKTDMEKTPEESFHEKVKAGITEEKEDAMLRVLESMSKKIEELDRTAKESLASTSVPNIRGQEFRTLSMGMLTEQPHR